MLVGVLWLVIDRGRQKTSASPTLLLASGLVKSRLEPQPDPNAWPSLTRSSVSRRSWEMLQFMLVRNLEPLLSCKAFLHGRSMNEFANDIMKELRRGRN